MENEDEPQLLGWLGDAILIAGSGETALRVTAAGAVEKINLPTGDVRRRMETEPCRPFSKSGTAAAKETAQRP